MHNIPTDKRHFGVIFDEFLGFKFDFVGEFDIRPLTLGVILVNPWASLMLCF